METNTTPKHHIHQGVTIDYNEQLNKWAVVLVDWDFKNKSMLCDEFRADTVAAVMNKIDELLADGWYAYADKKSSAIVKRYA